MNSKVFVDTDIVIDFFTDRAPFANAASELFELAFKKELQIYISALSINNIYYIVRKFLKHEKAIDAIKSLIGFTEIIGTSKSEIIQALNNDFKDFEDAIQYSTALTVNGIDAILTRNIKDYQKSEIPVFKPEHYLQIR